MYKFIIQFEYVLYGDESSSRHTMAIIESLNSIAINTENIEDLCDKALEKQYPNGIDISFDHIIDIRQIILKLN